MKREAKFQITFNHWLKDILKQVFVFKLPDCGFQNPFDVFSVSVDGKFSAWELKQTQKDYLPFSAVMPHQLDALCIVKGTVVIKYPEFFCLIYVDTFIKERNSSDRKSLTSERAKEIAQICVKI